MQILYDWIFASLQCLYLWILPTSCTGTSSFHSDFRPLRIQRLLMVSRLPSHYSQFPFRCPRYRLRPWEDMRFFSVIRPVICFPHDHEASNHGVLITNGRTYEQRASCVHRSVYVFPSPLVPVCVVSCVGRNASSGDGAGWKVATPVPDVGYSTCFTALAAAPGRGCQTTSRGYMNNINKHTKRDKQF